MKRLLSIVFISILLSSGIVAGLSGQIASAATTSDPPAGSSLAYASPSTITLNLPASSNINVADKAKVNTPFVFDNTTFTDGKILDENYNYTSTQGKCTSTIQLYPPSSGSGSYIGSSNALVTLELPGSLTSDPCLSYQYFADNVADPNGVGVTLFDWTSANQITAVTDNILLGQDSTNPQHFVSGNYKDLIGNTCHQSTLLGGLNCTVNCTMSLTLQADNVNGDAQLKCTGTAHIPDIGSHSQTQTIDFPGIKVAGSPGSPVTPPGDGVGGTGSAADVTPEIQCSTSITNPLSWLVCPIVLGIQKFVDLAENTITDYLTVPGGFFQTDGSTCSGPNTCSTGDAIFAAWDSVRNIALAMLGITALIMVLSQALSFGPFDAYTVKKVLPRILIAAILITLSWSIIQLVVAASNGIGSSVRHLIYLPFASLNVPNPSASTQLAGNLALVGGLGVLGLFGLLSFALTAALSLITGLAIIIIRQMVVILLAILAPIAIAAYILPGTDKIFKFWRDGLVGALVLFPIIEAIFAIGAVFAKIAQTNTFGGNSVFNQIVAFAAVVIPPFVLASVARRINGVVGTISGMGHDASKSLHGRVQKYRAGQAATNTAKLKAGNRFEGKGWIPGSRALARGVNRASVGIGTGAKGNFGLFEKGRQAVDQTRRQASIDQIMKSPAWNGINQNDDALMAATYRNAGEAQRELTARWGGDADRARRAVRATQASVGFGQPQAVAAAQQLVATGTGYNDLQDMTTTLARAAGGNTNTASALAGFANSETKKVGRFDLSPSYGRLNNLVQDQMATGGANNNYNTEMDASWRSAGLYSLANGKGVATQQFANHYLDRLQHGNQVEKRNAAIALMEMQNSLPSATGDNQNIINNTMFRLRNEVGARMGLDFDAGMSVEDQLAAVATHPANGTPAVDFQGRQLSGATIRGQARVYDRETNPNLANGNVQQQQGGP